MRRFSWFIWTWVFLCVPTNSSLELFFFNACHIFVVKFEQKFCAIFKSKEEINAGDRLFTTHRRSFRLHFLVPYTESVFAALVQLLQVPSKFYHKSSIYIPALNLIPNCMSIDRLSKSVWLTIKVLFIWISGRFFLL